MPLVGIQVFPGDGLIRPVDLGRAVEDRGFSALFFPEHLHMPVDRTFEFAIPGRLPEIYKRNLDPFVTFGAIAAVTTDLVLGTGVSLIAQRDPILTAKTIATLDQICEGRFVLGVGAGWNVEEMANHGVEPTTRWRRVREHVEAMRAIWSHDIATYHGQSVNFDRIWSWPKPFGGRSIPVLVGGNAKSFDRILRWADGWLPALDGDVDPLVAEIVELRTRWNARFPGRPLDVTVALGYDKRIDAAEFRRLCSADVTRVLFSLAPAPYDETVAALDDIGTIARAGGWEPLVPIGGRSVTIEG